METHHTAQRQQAPEPGAGQGRSARARSRTSPEPRGRLVVKPRDLEILCDLYHHGVMARSHLQAFHFSSLQRANARLRHLFDFGLVSRLTPPGLLRSQAAATQALYTLGAGAIPLVAEHLEVDEGEVRRVYRRTHTSLLVAHSLAVVEARLAFHRVARERSDLQMELWLAEGQIKHEYQVRAPEGA